MRKSSHQNGQIDWIKQDFTPLPEKPKGWVTANDIANETGNNIRTINDRLKKMVTDGVLDVMYCKDKGIRAKCYRKK